jgi:hypothetical protein
VFSSLLSSFFFSFRFLYLELPIVQVVAHHYAWLYLDWLSSPQWRNDPRYTSFRDQSAALQAGGWRWITSRSVAVSLTCIWSYDTLLNTERRDTNGFQPLIMRNLFATSYSVASYSGLHQSFVLQVWAPRKWVKNENAYLSSLAQQYPRAVTGPDMECFRHLQLMRLWYIDLIDNLGHYRC